MDIHSLRSLTGEVSSKLVVYTEDSFSKKWMEAIIRLDAQIAFDAVEVYPMGGDETAVKVNEYHNLDPSNKVKSICIIDGDSRQVEDPDKLVFRLPGEAPELHVFDEVSDKLEDCAPILAVRVMRKYADAEAVKAIIKSISNTNRDHHLIFSQIGEKVGFVAENIIIDAFLTTWCEQYPDEVEQILNPIKKFLPHVLDKTD